MTAKQLTTTALRRTLARAFFGHETADYLRYILPLTGNWTVPTLQPGEPVSTWLGYQIVRIVPVASVIARGDVLLKACKAYIRLWAVGAQAEEFITSTLFWDDRRDVGALFEEYLGKLIAGGREVLSLVYEQEGLNNELCWMTDIILATYIGWERSGARQDKCSPARGRQRAPRRSQPVWVDPYQALFTGGEHGV
jgi:hypothetical protein